MRSGDPKGQALAEFILVIPLFLVVMLGVVQFSLIYFAYQMVHYASFTASRAAIVRPCAALHPDDYADPNFTPAVFTAAVLATMAAAPPQCLLRDFSGSGPLTCADTDLDASYAYLLDLMQSFFLTPELEGLDFDARAGQGEIARTKYINAAYLTSVQRVENAGLGSRPIVWTSTGDGPGPGIPCDDLGSQQQNVPPPGSDITLEVTFLYPLIVPLVNRVVYGIFINFSSVAQDLGLAQIIGPGPGDRAEDVMVLPTRLLPYTDWSAQFDAAITAIFQAFGYSSEAESEVSNIADRLAARAWFPVPVRARCTLTVEGAVYPLTGPPTRRGW
jgi:hypothetical protein